MRYSFIAALFFLGAGQASIAAEETRFAVVGYLPEYRVRSVQAEHLKPVTDLIYFGIQPPADGQLAGTPVTDETLAKLKQIQRIASCRLFLCVGGWNKSQGFAALTKNRQTRTRFIMGLRDYCERAGFDGIDYDWEHPKNADEIANYQRLLVETKSTFADAKLWVTVAQAVWQDLGTAGYRAVDRVHLMSYDHDYPQATLSKSTADVNRVLGWGCPPGKIAMGIPFYGRNKKREAKTYSELVGNRKYDASVDVFSGYAGNGSATVVAKLRFAERRKLCGIMIWELGQDSPRPESSLLQALDGNLKSR